MIRSFGNQGTEDVFYHESTKAARKVCPETAWLAAGRKMDLLHQANDLRDLGRAPGLGLEQLKGKWKGWMSIRINSQYRIVFQWVEEGAEEVTIMDYHP
jgi:proteic killer suppression protein